MDDLDSHLHRAAGCEDCGWTGKTGDLIAGNKPGFRCPKCGGADIYVLGDAPRRSCHGNEDVRR